MSEAENPTTANEAGRVALKPRPKPNPLFRIEDVAGVEPHEQAKGQFERAEKEQRDLKRYRALITEEGAQTAASALPEVSPTVVQSQASPQGARPKPTGGRRGRPPSPPFSRVAGRDEADGPLVHQGFRIPEAWRRELRIFALKQGLTMQDLFEEWVRNILRK
jgi:hypothetical protein